MAKKTDAAGGSIFDLVKSLNSDADIIETAVWANSDDYIGTGSYILNAAVSGSLFGGLPNRRSMMLAGESGAGKSYLAASMAREAQKKGYTVIVLDSEGAWDKEFAGRIGVDTSKLIAVPVNVISEVNTFLANLCDKMASSKSKDKVFIILDSVGNLTSDKEKNDSTEGNQVRDMTKQQQLKALFRVNGLKMSKLAIPFLIVNHVYAKIDFMGGVEVSGGQGLKYNPSITMILTKAQLRDDKIGEKIVEQNKGKTDYTRTGVLVTATPFKSRFTRPVKVKFQIPFFKAPNPYVGLEQYLTWENSGVMEGELLTEKDYAKLSDAEKSVVKTFEHNGQTMYARPKVAGIYKNRKIVVARLGQTLPITELFTDKVFTDELLHKLDDEIIKPTFQLPSGQAQDDLDEFFTDDGGDINGNNE